VQGEDEAGGEGRHADRQLRQAAEEVCKWWPGGGDGCTDVWGRVRVCVRHGTGGV
jgi:hypothetical protein